MAEEKDNLLKIKAKQDAIAKKAVHPANDAAKMAEKQKAGQGNQGNAAKDVAAKEEQAKREEIAALAKEDFEEKVEELKPTGMHNLLGSDPITSARDEEKILAGVIPAPAGTGDAYNEVVEKSRENFVKKVEARRAKFKAQQAEAFGHLSKGDGLKAVEEQAGDSPKNVNAVKPEGGSGPSDGTAAATAQGTNANTANTTSTTTSTAGGTKGPAK